MRRRLNLNVNLFENKITDLFTFPFMQNLTCIELGCAAIGKAVQKEQYSKRVMIIRLL